MIRKTLLTLTLLWMQAAALQAQVALTEQASARTDFELVAADSGAAVCYDAGDAAVVETAAGLFAADVARVTGREIPVVAGQELPAKTRCAVIVGTIGQSRWIDELIAAKKIDVSAIEGGWERYAIRLVERPGHGVRKALVIAGSDRRGTAYGLLSVSRAIGVSPWYWWADAPVRHRDRLTLRVGDFTSESPSVKYRGIFINDEDWGLYRWAKENFEKELGNIGPKTYEKVCELLLRLQANYLAPAMHDATTAFYKIPENMRIADRYAIAVGSSHCEPLGLNTASEWDSKTMGEWDYVNNRAGVDRVLKERVETSAPYENVYTLALRGLHDRAMAGSENLDARKATMQEALLSQRQILTEVLGKPAEEIPQAFTPYKEVLDVYNRGLELPDDVTIIWPDDNYGYMKRLSSPAEQKRSGRSGVYYHSSYLGRPHDYLWMNTTSPTLMYEELRKAYDSTADRIWLLNAGDIKSCEFAVDFFLAMAWDIDSFDFLRAADYRAEWMSGLLGREYFDRFREISDTFYHLAFVRKPEFMGWGYQWATDKHGKERNTDTDFSFANYREADRRLEAYARIAGQTEALMDRMPEANRACFYQVLYYPVKACELLNRMVLRGQQNRRYATQQRAATDALAAESRMCHDSLRIITAGYNALLGGKWNHVMTMNQGFAASYFQLPELRSAQLAPGAVLEVEAENEDVMKGLRSFHMLPTFDTFLRRSHFVDVYNKGREPLQWSASARADRGVGGLDESSRRRRGFGLSDDRRRERGEPPRAGFGVQPGLPRPRRAARGVCTAQRIHFDPGGGFPPQARERRDPHPPGSEPRRRERGAPAGRSDDAEAEHPAARSALRGIRFLHVRAGFRRRLHLRAADLRDQRRPGIRRTRGDESGNPVRSLHRRRSGDEPLDLVDRIRADLVRKRAAELPREQNDAPHRQARQTHAENPVRRRRHGASKDRAGFRWHAALLPGAAAHPRRGAMKKGTIRIFGSFLFFRTAGNVTPDIRERGPRAS